MGVPAIYLFLSQAAGFADADLSSLRRAVVGGAPMPETLLETWQRRGIDIVQGYGLTEAAPNVLCLPPEDARAQDGLRRQAVPVRDLRAARRRHGRPARGRGRGRARRARARTSSPATGATTRRPRAVFDGGWLRTGDIAERDDEGYYRIRGRLKELFISGGENVYPAEVEHALMQHPAVADVAVVGVPDERWGEVGAAFVVLETGATASEDELREHCCSPARALQGAEVVHLRRRAAAVGDEQGAEGRAARGARGARMTDVAVRPGPTAAACAPAARARGRSCSTAAEDVFTELGYHEASIVKITEAAGVAQGTFYLYFGSKQDVFEEVVLDLNRRVRHYDQRGGRGGHDAARARRCSASAPTSASRPSTRRSTASSGRPSSSRRTRSS